MSFRNWLEHEYLLDQPSKADSLKRVDATNSFLPKTHTQRWPNPDYDPDMPMDFEKSIMGTPPLDYQLKHPNWRDKINKELSKDITTPAELSLNNKRIIVSKYRHAPIALPIHNKSVFIDHHDGEKPRGGTWYAFGEKWIEFVNANMPNKIYMFIHQIIINKENVYMMNTSESKRIFEEKYGTNQFPKENPRLLINWPEVVKDYDGIEVSADGLQQYGWQEYWDIPSGCVWRQSGIKDSKLIYVYNIKTNKYVKPSELGIYAGKSSKSKNPLPEIKPN